MSNLFNKLMTQQVEEQKKALEESKKQNDTDNASDAVASQRDATASRQINVASQSTPKIRGVNETSDIVLDKSLMREIISELSHAEVVPSAISIRMSADEKQYIDDFILDTLRREKLQGAEVSIAKLMRYSLIYLLLKHQKEFTEVLKRTLIKKDSGRLFQ